jgi:hypothetical protein
MHDLQFLGEVVVAVAAMTAPIIVATRWLAGEESEVNAWPRGVQEEDSVRWNVRLLDRAGGRDRQLDTPHPTRHRPLPLPR